MGLLESIFGKRPKKVGQAEAYFKTLTAYSPVWHTWGGALYESDLIRASIDAGARHASKLVIGMMGNANKSLRSKLRAGPNSWQTYSQFIYRLYTILEMQNNAFITPVLDEYGDIEGYFPILPSRTVIKEIDGEPWIEYTFSDGRKGYMEMARTGIMTRHQYHDDVFGESNKPLNGTMSLLDMQKQGIMEGIKNGATFRFMARLGNFQKPEDLAKERQRFNRENLQGESGGILLFPNTYQDPKQIDQKPYVVDAEQMKLIQENVFNYFGTNMDVIQNKAVGDKWAAFYDGKLEPFAVQLSQVLTKMTFSKREISMGNEFTVTANRLQYASTQEKLNVSAQMADRGIMNRNEIREIWGLPPVEGGDAFLVRGEYKDPDKDEETVTQIEGEQKEETPKDEGGEMDAEE